MKKRNKIFIFSAIILIFAIAGYLLICHKGFLQKRSVAYVQHPVVAESLQDDGQQVQAQEQQQQSQQAQQNAAQTVQSAANTNTGQSNNDSKAVSAQTTTPTKKADSPTSDQKSDIINRLVSWGFQKSVGRSIDTIIVHTSYDAVGNDPYSVDGIIAEWKAAGVSPHYLIARDGTIYHLVDDQNIAYHAGVSKMPDGRTNVNDFSIGVEMVNTQTGKFTDAQYSALNQLIASLKNKYPIKYVLGHDDIAPGRKTDPWGMDWSKVNR